MLFNWSHSNNTFNGSKFVFDKFLEVLKKHWKQIILGRVRARKDGPWQGKGASVPSRVEALDAKLFR